MSPFISLGRALGIVERDNIRSELVHAVDQDLPDSVIAQKPTIERARDTSVSLLETMRRRASILEDQISTAQEELRQVRVVIAGATSMLDTVEKGMVDAKLPNFAKAPRFTSELPVASPLD